MKSISKNISTVKKLLFVILCSVAAVIYTAQQLGLHLPNWINNYVNDFLCMPIVLIVCQYVVRIIKTDQDFRIPLSVIISLTLYFAVYFEFYLPSFNPRYTADFIDIVLYFSGAISFYLTELLPFRK